MEVALGYEEICSDSSGNRMFIRRKHQYMKLINPFTMEDRLMSRLRREKMSWRKICLAPFHHIAIYFEDIGFTDGTKVINKNSGDFISRAQSCRIP